jgi:hypothetical protein
MLDQYRLSTGYIQISADLSGRRWTESIRKSGVDMAPARFGGGFALSRRKWSALTRQVRDTMTRTGAGACRRGCACEFATAGADDVELAGAGPVMSSAMSLVLRSAFRCLHWRPKRMLRKVLKALHGGVESSSGVVIHWLTRNYLTK